MTAQDHAKHVHTTDGSCCSGEAGSPAAVIRDPVCGMTVDPAAGKPSSEHDGRVFHFCLSLIHI